MWIDLRLKEGHMKHLHQGSGDLDHPFVGLIAVLPIPIALPASDVAVCFPTKADEGCIRG